MVKSVETLLSYFIVTANLGEKKSDHWGISLLLRSGRKNKGQNKKGTNSEKMNT